jgi:hypothetical protein
MADSVNLLKSEEFEAILKLCSRYRVKALKCGNLELSWDEHIVINDTPVPKAEILAEQTKEQEKALRQAEFDLKQEQIDNMLIEDPSYAEELIASGELLDESDGAEHEA